MVRLWSARCAVARRVTSALLGHLAPRMGTTFLLGAEVSTDMTRFSLWHAHEDAASLPAAATHTYRSSGYSVGTFLFSGFEMMLADFVEKAKGACPDFGGVPATACFALVDDPESLPWAISGGQVEVKFGLSGVRVVRCTTANSGDVECSTGESFSIQGHPTRSDGSLTNLDRLCGTQSMGGQVPRTLRARAMADRGRWNGLHDISQWSCASADDADSHIAIVIMLLIGLWSDTQVHVCWSEQRSTRRSSQGEP